MIRNRPHAARLLLAAGCSLLGLGAASAYALAPQPGAGESIYLRGVLPSGAPLEGQRQDAGLTARGADAACVNCHQRSGLGTSEGYNLDVTIPPITGAYLFHSREATTKEAILPYVEWMHGNRDPYTDATLARAIREGLDSQGRPLHPLMPRFTLSDADMASLIELPQATRLAPGPGRHRQGAALRHRHHAGHGSSQAPGDARRSCGPYFADKNVFPIGNSRNMRTSGKTEYAKSMFMSHRQWQLHVWELTGSASTWRAQLDGFMARAAGAGAWCRDWVAAIGRRWSSSASGSSCLACFRTSRHRSDDSHDFYSLYFSRGVLLEAESDRAPDRRRGSVERFHRHRAAGLSCRRPRRGRGCGAGRGAEDLAASRRTAASCRPGRRGKGVGRRSAAHPRRAACWCCGCARKTWRRWAMLSEAPASVFISGLMGGLEHAPLPQAWRGRVRMAYPYDLPEKPRACACATRCRGFRSGIFRSSMRSWRRTPSSLADCWLRR